MFIKSKFNIEKMFTENEKYFIVDYVENGVVVYDNQNQVHILSDEFVKKNFEKC